MVWYVQTIFYGTLGSLERDIFCQTAVTILYSFSYLLTIWFNGKGHNVMRGKYLIVSSCIMERGIAYEGQVSNSFFMQSHTTKISTKKNIPARIINLCQAKQGVTKPQQFI